MANQKKEILINLLSKQFNSRIVNLEKKYCEFTKYINMCIHIVKSYSKLDFGLLIENNIEKIFDEEKGETVRLESKLKLLTPTKIIKRSQSKANREYSVKVNKHSINLKLNNHFNKKRELSPTSRNRIKSPKKDQATDNDSNWNAGQTRLDTIDSIRNQMKSSQTLKNLFDVKKRKIKAPSNKTSLTIISNCDDKFSQIINKSPKTTMNKSNNKFNFKSAQMLNKDKNKKISPSDNRLIKTKINFDFNIVKKNEKNKTGKIGYKSFLKQNLTTSKSNFSNFETKIINIPVKSSKNVQKTPFIKEFKNSDCYSKIVPKNEINISNIFIDNNDNMEDYIITNQFDLLTEEFLNHKNEFLKIEKGYDEIYNIYKNENKIEFDDIIEDIWLNLSNFLNDADLGIILCLNKKYFRSSVQVIITRINVKIELLEESLSKLKEKYKDEIYKKSTFIVAKNTSRAIELLNEISYQNIFNQTKTPNPDIIFPYRVYFQLLNSDITNLNDVDFFIECCKYFKSKKQIGNAINDSVKNFNFSEKNILKISKLIKKKEKNFSPSYYSSKCVTTGLLIFLLKDALEYLGVLIDKRNNPFMLSSTLKYRCEEMKKMLIRFKSYEANL